MRSSSLQAGCLESFGNYLNLTKSNWIFENPWKPYKIQQNHRKSMEMMRKIDRNPLWARRLYKPVAQNPWKSMKILQNPTGPWKTFENSTKTNRILKKNLWESIKALIPKPCTGASHLYPDHVSPGHLHFPYSPEPSAPAKPSGGFCFAERFPGLVLKVLLVTISRAARV